MNQGLYLGKIRGIQVRLDWSWLPVFLFGTPVLMFGLSSLYPEWQADMSVVVALVMLLLALGAVILHQIGHTLMAQIEDCPVTQVLLFPFGGISNVHIEPSFPASETKIALAGPLTSMVSGMFLALGGSIVTGLVPSLSGGLLGTAIQSGVGGLLLWWFAAANVFLAVLNLLPGSPLDGGRVLRAKLWQGSDDLYAATRWAAWAGDVVGWLIILVGMLLFLDSAREFTPRLFTAVWVVLLGWFIKSASENFNNVVNHNPLAQVPVSALNLSEPIGVSPYLTLRELFQHYVLGTANQVFVVKRGELLLGILTLEDIWNVPEDRWERELVKFVMTPPERLQLLRPDENAARALERLEKAGKRSLPVVEHDRLIGLLQRQDILNWLEARGQQQAQRAGTPRVDFSLLLQRLRSAPRPRQGAPTAEGIHDSP